MAKIIQIIDVEPAGIRVRLDDGSYTTLAHNAGWSPSVGDEIPGVSAELGFAEPKWNLTDQQWDLLQVLVDNHVSNGGVEFHFACAFGGCGITYPGGKAIPGVRDQTDLLQLRSERLVTLTRTSRDVHRGKPTQLGITTARHHFSKPAEADPFPADHRSHLAWKQLPTELRDFMSRLSMQHQLEILELDKAFQEKLAETGSLDLVERYILERFDLTANLQLRFASPGPTAVKSEYESFLDILLKQEQERVEKLVPRELRSDVRDEIISRISLKLSSRKIHWLGEEIAWRLQGCLPRSHSKVVPRFLDPERATETSSSIDAFVRRMGGQPDANGRASSALVVSHLGVSAWENLEIVFLSEQNVQITINSQHQAPLNYAELGFEDKRTKNPNGAWKMLWDLAQNGGACRIASDSKRWKQIERRMQEIRKAFRNRFDLQDDPIPLRKKTRKNREDFGYTAKFKITCHPASKAESRSGEISLE